jgi:NAD(P)-dependent dehydrogenase (short-subunit alcohol dehydrogenase family)
LITGGTGGLGRAVVAAFLEDGWRVVVPTILAGPHDRLPAEVETLQADLTDPDDVARVVRTAAGDREQPLRGLANLVGGFRAGQPVADTPFAEFEALFDLNLRPTYLVTQAALPVLRAGGGGSIVCVSTRAALRPFAGAAGYCASKAAVRVFAEVVAAEGKADGVRCNAILPSVIDTPANRRAMGEDAAMVAPAEIARVIAFLLSDDSAPTSGAAIPVYGRA